MKTNPDSGPFPALGSPVVITDSYGRKHDATRIETLMAGGRMQSGWDVAGNAWLDSDDDSVWVCEWEPR